MASTLAVFAGYAPCQRVLVKLLCDGKTVKVEFRRLFVSKLQRVIGGIIYTHLGHFEIKENYRPEWLQTAEGGRLELDFFIEELNVAIEVQGRQHYQFVPYFHCDYDDFQDLLSRDRLKASICARKGIELHEVSSESDMLEILPEINKDIISEPHPNAVKQANAVKFTKSRRPKEKRKKKQHILNYPKTINKHLRKLYRLSCGAAIKDLSEKEIYKVYISLLAIKQYQDAKELTISFNPPERALLTIAHNIVGDILPQF